MITTADRTGNWPADHSYRSTDVPTEQVESPWDVQRIRQDFPILQTTVGGKPLIYLDNVATAQKPKCVIDAVSHHYQRSCANVHRGAHHLSVEATRDYENARSKVRRFVDARRTEEIVFVRNTTEGINLIAQTFGRTKLSRGDEVLISHMEHHSNIVPWQMLCRQTSAKLRVIPINDHGELIFDAYEQLLTPATKLVAITYISNALGTINPIKEVIDLAHKRDVPVLIDGAQAVPHIPVSVRDLDCDFFVFSGHKMYGPTGVGVVYGKYSLLNALPPYQGGGEMISTVTFEETKYADLPHRFEAGTPDIAGVIGLGSAIDYLEKQGLNNIAAYEDELLKHGTELLSSIPEIRLIGTAKHKAAVLSFVVDGVHAHDVSTVLDQEGIAVRAGHHCAQPVMDRFGVPATTRASLAFYNTREELDKLATAIRQVVKIFK